MSDENDLKYFKIPILNITAPISPALYKDSALKYALPICTVGFILIWIFWGEVVLADAFGMSISFFLISYIIHMVRMF